jgi:protein-S-isoprenylcysteine O-methyltransferase Ste14
MDLLSDTGSNLIWDFNRWFLAVFFTAVALFYLVRILVLKRKSNKKITRIGKPGTTHFATHVTFRIFRMAIWGACAARLIWPGFDTYLVTMPYMLPAAGLMIGNLLMLGGFTAIIAINFYMKDDWRSGVPEPGNARLITNGPFRWSRNPMMLFVMMTQLGFFLALPSLFSLTCLLVGVIAVFIQVGVEEQALKRQFGERYREYRNQTPRWFALR